MTIHYQDDTVTLHHGDCLDVLRSLPDASVDAVVTDPPYGLEFMGKDWDAPWKPSSVGRGVRVEAERAAEMTAKGKGHSTSGGPYLAARVDSVRVAGKPFQDWCTEWAAECLRVLKPGGHMLAFGGSRTWHRLAAAVEDAGFEIRDSIAWLYGSGFPKSMDVAKAIDKRPGVAQHAEFAAELTSARVAAGLTAAEVSEAVTGNRTGACWNWEHHQFPEARWWPALRDLLAMDGSRWNEVIAEAARVPTGQHRSDNWSASGYAASGRGTDRFDAPATALAQQWQGWGTALKPSFEPIVVARKPLAGTVAATVLAYGTGALNIDGCRVGDEQRTFGGPESARDGSQSIGAFGGERDQVTVTGRWPANVVLDGDQADDLDAQTGTLRSGLMRDGQRVQSSGGEIYGKRDGFVKSGATYGDEGGASRFFPVFRYEAKAPTSERPRVDGVAHPTVKPIALMRWLVRLVTPPGGTVLEPFAGSGTTVEACVLEGFRCIAIEREADYLPLIEHRLRRRDMTAPITVEVAPGAMQDGFDFGEVTA